jgi:two-component system response regulator YesN
MKILIVDDETGVHDQLRSSIPWMTLGWAIIGDAYDGEEACRLMRECQPDIVITDIKMPLMDGLTFMESLKADKFAGKVIVLSGYGDFEYSRTAFLMDVFDYLLKPLNEAELLSVLGKAAIQLERESETKIQQIDERAVLNKGIVLMQDEFLTSVASAAIRDENEMFVGADPLGICLPETKFVVIVLQLVDSEEIVQKRYDGNRPVFYFAVRNIVAECLGQEAGIIFRNLGKTHEYVIVYSDDSKNSEHAQRFVKRIEPILSACLRVSARFGISSAKQRPKAIPDAYLEAYQAAEGIRIGSSLVHGQSVAKHGCEKVPVMETLPYWEALYRLVESLMETGTLPGSVNLLDKLDEALSDDALSRMSGHELKKSVTLFLDKIDQGLRKPNGHLILPIHQARLHLNEWNIQLLRSLLRTIIGELKDGISGDQTLKSGRQLVELVKKFAVDHYKNVSLEEISQRFYLNKNYFSSLFKSVTGENFTEFLTRTRMEQAKWFLAHTDRKTYQIANLVGYDDQRYFSKVFKKYEGVQPSEFRSQQQKKVRLSD